MTKQKRPERAFFDINLFGEQYPMHTFDVLPAYLPSKLPIEYVDTVMEQYGDINVDFDWWWDCTLYNFVEDVAKRGFEVDIKKIYFSGFYHQGSGSGFSSNVDVKTFINTHDPEEYSTILEYLDDVYISAGTTGHDNCISFGGYYEIYINPEEFESDDEYEDVYSKLDEECENLLEHIEEVANELNSTLFDALRDEYEYRISEEAVLESLDANNYAFGIDEDDELVELTHFWR